MTHTPLHRLTLLLPFSALLLVGCSTEPPPSQEDDTDTGLHILASTDVYSDLAAEIVGDTAEVSAIVSSTAVDPHSYEATPRDRLAVDEADVLIANGGGYDAYITLLANAADKDDAVYQLIDGENWHSHEFDGTYENEHIWYDLSRMSEFVIDFGDHMAGLAPENADTYRDNAASLAAKIDELDSRNQGLGGEGHSYLATEAVSGFLLQDAGFEDRTELEFLSAVEHGDDVSPRLYQDALQKASGEELDLLSYNPQTKTNQALQIREAAEGANVAVLEFSETIPEDADGYLDWMNDNITKVEGAIESFD